MESEQIVYQFNFKSEKISILAIGNTMAFPKSLKQGKKIHFQENKKVILFFGTVEPHKVLNDLNQGFFRNKEKVHY